MEKTAKALNFLNIIGFSVVSVALIVSYMLNPFSWGIILIGLNLLTSIPFIISGLIFLRNIHNPDSQTIQKVVIGLFLFLWLPSIGLPFAYELGGLVISLIILLVGLYAILGIKNPLSKIQLVNWIGMLFLIVNTFLVLGVVFQNT